MMHTKIKEISKNKYLISACILLLVGVIIGVCVLNFLPEELKSQLGTFVLKGEKSVFNSAINKLAFPTFVLVLLYLGGFNAVGHVTVSFAMLCFGMIYGIKNALNFYYIGNEFIIKDIADYFTFSIYTAFLVITMAESSFLSSQYIYKQLHENTYEKPLYNAKNQAVKLLTFTAIITAFSILSGYISTII